MYSKVKVSTVCTKDEDFRWKLKGNRNIVFRNIISYMNWFVILFDKSAGTKEWQPEDNRVRKNQLDAQLILYMFRAYLGPSSGGTTACIQQLVLVILFRWLSVVLVGLEFQSNRDNRLSSKKNNKYQLLNTYSCTSWWWT